MGMIIFSGLALSARVRRVISVTGRMLTGDEFITARVIMSSLAVVFGVLSFCIFAIADSANGVAALPMPRIFAAIFAEHSSMPLPVLYAVGKSSLSRGDMSLESNLIAPAVLSTSSKPLYKHITDNSPILRSTARAAPSNMAGERL